MAVLATSGEWTRVANTTLPRFVKGAEDATFRRRVLLAMLKSKGRVKTNVSGDGLSWRVRYSRAPMKTNNGAQPIAAAGRNRWAKAFLDYEGYQVDDFITEREKLKNRNAEAILNIYGSQITDLMEDITDQFAEEIYTDSTAAGNEAKMSGIETMMGINGTVNIATGAQRSANVLDAVGYPSSTYATLSTQLASLGGSWKTQSDINSTWPYGSGTPEYDATSPTIVNYGYAWDGTNHDWAHNALIAARFGIWAMKRNKDVSIPMLMFTTGMYRQLLELIAPKERINVENSGVRKLGFGNAFYWDDAEITSEFGVPASVGYGFDINSMQLFSLLDVLFRGRGPIELPLANGWATIVDCLGNFKFASPRNFLKFQNIASS